MNKKKEEGEEEAEVHVTKVTCGVGGDGLEGSDKVLLRGSRALRGTAESISSRNARLVSPLQTRPKTQPHQLLINFSPAPPPPPPPLMANSEQNKIEQKKSIE
ncbi:unnamed protein product [Arctogadus glacialis]